MSCTIAHFLFACILFVIHSAYLLLENVTHTYRYPNILDLKIGTQMDRFDCSPEKKDKHLNLVQSSSTGSLGLRVAGMQVCSSYISPCLPCGMLISTLRDHQYFISALHIFSYHTWILATLTETIEGSYRLKIIESNCFSFR